jgi:hypothetical protein
LLHVLANLICSILSFTSNGSTFVFSKISSFLLWSNRVYPAVYLKNVISTDAYRILKFFLRVQISIRHKKVGRVGALYTFILEKFWTKCLFKSAGKIPPIWEHFTRFCWKSFFFIFTGNFAIEIFKILYFCQHLFSTTILHLTGSC